MIDWTNAVLPYVHSKPINEGQCVFLSSEGEVLGTTQRKAMVRGSYDSKCAIQSSTDHHPGEYIWISGSPKFLQGHNLFGSDDPRKLAAHLARGALAKLGLSVDPFTWERWLSGRGVKFSRIDVTSMLDTGSELHAAEWLAAVGQHARLKHRGRGREDHGTVYFGKNSRRWALKLYRKLVELESPSKSHRLPDEIEHRQKLLEYARGTVRAELVFHSMELKALGAQRGEAWASLSASSLWSAYMQKLELPGTVDHSTFDAERLPRELRLTFLSWRDGRDLRASLPRTTLYRHRAALKRYGFDIFTPCPREVRSRVVPLLRVVEALPKAVPSWAFNSSLLYAA